MTTRSKLFNLTVTCCFFFFAVFHTGYSQNNTTIRLLRDWEKLTSPNGRFRMQFFSLGSSPNRYLGIFFNSTDIDKAFWIANRNSPIPDASGNLIIDFDGRLKISYSTGIIDIVVNSIPATSNVNATLLDTGNFVLRDMNLNGTVKRVLWESFDYPTDTLLPGMKVGINFRTGHVWSLTSWRSDVLPASGSFTFGGDPGNTSQLIIWWRGNISWRSGPWSNGTFENIPRASIEPGYTLSYVSNADERYFTFLVDPSQTYDQLSRYTMVHDGYLDLQLSNFIGTCFRTSREIPISIGITSGCEDHGWPQCRLERDWIFRKVPLARLSGSGFRYNDRSNMSLFDCDAACRNDCSCVAFSVSSYNETGCTIYGQKEINEPTFSTSAETYYMVFTVKKRGKLKPWMTWLIVGFGVVFLIQLLCCLCLCIKRRKHRWRARERLLFDIDSNNTNLTSYYTKDEKMSEELQSFSFETISLATKDFDTGNKLGEGGFGPVYKGRLADGKEVAIKRLARSSGQGLEEFRNEILLIAKLQHTNLVRLLGCCIQGQEKILVYEYMCNKSLDYFLFKSGEKELLNWAARFNIIEGIAQGLLYLHKYSRLRIIHRDLKASNILLDGNFNPKISDFGMARIFGINESKANTIRVVGTYGYMSPEYAMKGIFSVKSDVYSFGVLLLEIVCSKRNNGNYNSERQLNLNGLAWELWNEGRAEELIDATLDDCISDQALRCIHVSLLCAQDNAIDRPSMSEVISMLTNETMQLPAPKQPAFFIDTRLSSADGTSKKDKSSGNHSVNGLTLSMVQAR